MTVKIYHNPRCSKSRETLALLKQQGIEPEIELYLEKQYSVDFLQQLAQKLQLNSVREMMRTKDELYRTLHLGSHTVTETQLLEAIAQHSALLERPIVVNGEKAKIGRPPESVLAIL
ncbi:arsenate reductase (glutaredoxin) [Avibacterium sp. 20-15]|uniref:arsenate reductase (glutaredoxin) n=1 Tax=unclassified Avibacterium TaxID=2685287 RepID=UPI0020269440|nr:MULTISPECIES: arsenate reductase (glutaredoxin) [unclassified Avibacterium]MCW9733354.1 arsenate reductase (glutaredoxin) [Avibacterium sp. 20-15]URL03228.1 arsenate reductase (glutaredoxin) [Avibacterium sp. 20-132]